MGPKEIPSEIANIAQFVRSKLKTHNGIEMGKRMEYFKGEKLLQFLQEKKSKKDAKVYTLEEATKIAHELLRDKYFHHSEKVQKKHFQPSTQQKFDPKGYYVWDFQGSQLFKNMLTGLLILGVLLIVCFPIWPRPLKLGLVRILSGLGVFFFGILLVRCIVFVAFWVIGFDFWFFPDLFNEELGVADSFKRVVSFSRSGPGQGWYRLAIIIIITILVYFLSTQPTGFDEFVKNQKQFVEDVYEGKFLSERSQEEVDNIDKVRILKVEELEEQLRQDELEELKTSYHEDDSVWDDSEQVDDFLDRLIINDEEDEKEYSEKNPDDSIPKTVTNNNNQEEILHPQSHNEL